MKNELLIESAASERLGRSFIPHVAGLSLNLAAGLYLWLQEDRPMSGLVAFGGGALVTELKIFTEPITASRALEAYRAGTWRSGAAAGAARFLTVGFGAFPAGVVLTGTF
ncbi:MAG TPA: hypothetical protein VJT73_15670 [Polyangiaceae bacterium]|nr:hypothetical protein [Polyangiaceae bacterium]